jgi:hypothetical protein
VRKRFKLSILFISICILLFLIRSLFTSYKENVIYPEKIIPEYSTNSLPNNYISREEAMNIALKVLKNGFLITLDREKVYEDIQIYKKDKNMVWLVNFTDKSDLEISQKYYCEILVETGEILSVGRSYNRGNKLSEEDYLTSDYKINDINLDKFKEIIKPLTEELNLYIKEETMNVSYNYRGLIYLEVFENNESTKGYSFVVDNENNNIISFYRGAV